jgi:hypothetical protein
MLVLVDLPLLLMSPPLLTLFPPPALLLLLLLLNHSCLILPLLAPVRLALSLLAVLALVIDIPD